MKKSFIDRVLRETCVETKKYCYRKFYHYTCDSYYIEIKRIAIEKVGTTGMMDNKNWEVVKIYTKDDAELKTNHIKEWLYSLNKYIITMG